MLLRHALTTQSLCFSLAGLFHVVKAVHFEIDASKWNDTEFAISSFVENNGSQYSFYGVKAHVLMLKPT